jgi:WD40 repeat protein
MAMVESELSIEGTSEGGTLVYDGFISYSHAADDLLAPRLQSGLQRFAKPWWRRRALRVFRDESSLSANPHLWSSITEALDQSGWFVLLLSPDAASSEWVNQEIEYWKEHKDPSRILPVLTDGTFGWTDGDVSGTAVPEQLHDVFSEEPRWVDLRFAREEDQLDLKNPAFSNVIADIASAMRGIPKDELASEEVKQHRRAVRTAWTAGIGLATLAVAAIGFAIQSTSNARAAESGRLAASALAVLEEDPELSVLLGLEALRLSPESAETLDSLTQAMQTHKTVFTARPPDGFGGDQLAVGSISPDGSLMAASFYPPASDESALRGIVAWDIADGGNPKWIKHWDGPEFPGVVSFTNDGARILAEVAAGPEDPDFDWVVLDAASGETLHSLTLRCRTGWFAGPAQSGPFVDLSKPILMSAFEEDGEGGCSVAEEAEIVAVDIWTGEQDIVGFGPSTWGTLSGMPTMNADGTRLAVSGDCCEGTVTEIESGNVLLTLPRGLSSISPDGKFVLASNQPLELWSVDEAQKLREFQGEFSVAWFSGDGALVYGSTYEGNTLIFDRETGAELHNLRGHGGRQINAQLTTDRSYAGTFSADDTARLWRTRRTITPTADVPAFDVGSQSAFFALGNAWANEAEIVIGRVDLDAEPIVSTVVYEANTGERLREHPWLTIAVSADLGMAAYQDVEKVVLTDEEAGGPGTGGEYDRTGSFVIADLQTGESITELEGICDFYQTPTIDSPIPASECEGYPGLWHEFTQAAAFSSDGSMFAIAGHSGHVAVWNTATGKLIHVREADLPSWVIEQLDYGSGHVEFTPDGEHLALTGGFDFIALTVLSTDTWEEVASLDLTQPFTEMDFTPDGSHLVGSDANADVVLIETAGWTETDRLKGQQGGSINDVSVSPDGRFAATAGQDNQVLVWDLETRKIANRLSLSPLSFGVRNVDWVNDQTIFVSTRPAGALMTLEAEVIRASALGLVTRGLSEQECATYRIDPCPSLDDFREG